MTPHPSAAVGRGRIREVVHDQLDDGQSVLLTGDAGIGKTWLATSVLAEPSLARRVAARLIGTEETSAIQLATLAEGVALPSRATPPEIYAALLRRWSRRHPDLAPPLVLLDDAQHADPTTASVLRIGVAAGELQLLACRRDPLPLPRHLEALVSGGAMTAVPLGRLGDEAIRRVVTRSGPGLLPPGMLDTVIELARGNPLYARELASAARHGRSPRAQGTLEHIVGRTVLARTPEQRRLLELVAVAGALPMELVPDRDVLTELRAAGLLVRDDLGIVRLDHPLRRQWLLGELGDAAPAALGSFLDAVGAAAARSLDPVRYVDWCRFAGRHADTRAVEEAVASALARADPRTALRLLDGHDAEDADGLRAQALMGAGRRSEAQEALETRLARRAPTPALALWCVRHFALGEGDVDRAEQVVSALEAVGSTPARLAAVRSRLWIANFCRAPDHLPVAEWADSARLIPEPGVAAETLAALAAAVMTSAGPLAGAALADESVRRLDNEPWSPSHGRTLAARSFQQLVAGQMPSAVASVHEVVDTARRRRDVETALWMAGVGGLVLSQAGRIRQSLSVSRPSVWDEMGDEWFGFTAMGALSHHGTLAYVGTPPPPMAREQALRGPGSTPAQWARACDLASGQRGEQHDDAAVLAALATAAARRHLGYAVCLLAECVDLGSAPEVHREVAALYPEDLGGLMTLVGRSARARLATDPTTLAALADEAERSGWVSAALRLTADVLTLEDAQTLGDARARLLRLLDRWDVQAPWFLPPHPTRRQREVAGQVARGRSTREIAAELGLSPRTIDNHLQRVFDYLGVHDRARLATVLSTLNR